MFYRVDKMRDIGEYIRKPNDRRNNNVMLRIAAARAGIHF